mmetsp:Transcript_20185/g.56249  ORF Transcript_20185/g.56249 Transcript_20185/m.56249 type:complete len:141 (-) Transcript_20185:1338-1760(-)
MPLLLLLLLLHFRRHACLIGCVLRFAHPFTLITNLTKSLLSSSNLIFQRTVQPTNYSIIPCAVTFSSIPSSSVPLPQFRYFLQPFLVLYYAPLVFLRSITSPAARSRDTYWSDVQSETEKAEQRLYEEAKEAESSDDKSD